MVDELSERIQKFLERKAAEAVPIVAEYYESDARAREHPAEVVVHPSGSVQVEQGGVVHMERYPSVRARVTPTSTAEEIESALLQAWAGDASEMSDYPLEDED